MAAFVDDDHRGRKRISWFRSIDAVSRLGVTVVVNVAVEKTIIWNDIQGVHSTGSAGQIIPLVIGLAAVVRIFYVFFFDEDESNFTGIRDPYSLPMAAQAASSM